MFKEFNAEGIYVLCLDLGIRKVTSRKRTEDYHFGSMVML